MISSGVIIYTSNDYKFSLPQIYHNSTWVNVTPYVYTGGAWEKAGAAGCPMVFLYDKDGNIMVDKNNNYILVKDKS